MVRALIEGMLGPLGTQVLLFYEANSLPINLIVVSYGLVMVLAWSNLVNIRKRLLKSMLAQMLDQPGIDASAKLKRILREIDIPWESAIGQSWYPFVARQMAFWPRRASVETIQALLPAEELATQALELLEELTNPTPKKRRAARR